ncbi:hypothetical protein PBY51_002612 [Eleginops maclovinus]|uniref:Uncharacterized protein n=1 Tax=Eleginops maclovinus TaxID=56733 RepID=A0AAN8AKP5_ELEMC|nr:hypothetical protein PBY51_002612 [Eleginops maclovinus]
MGATSDKVRIKEAESLMSACSLVDAEGEGGHYVLRPTLLPHIEELLPKRLINNAGRHGENEGNSKSVEGHKKEGPFGGSNGVTSLLFGISGLVFKSVPVNLWAPPAFHELLLRGIFPSDCNPVKLFGQRLEELLAPYGVSLSTDQGGLRLKAQPMGLVGRVFASNEGDNISDVCVTVSLNLDLLAVLLFSLPDWRLLWSHDPRFIQHFELCPSPGKPFQPFSLYPEHFSFDISFWTGPMWMRGSSTL